MADNTVLIPGTTGDTIRTEDRTTFKTPVSIIDQGAAGGAESLVDSTNPLYTQLRSEIVDDAAFTPATSRIIVVGAMFDNTLPDSVDEGDGGALRMSANRNLYVNIRDNAGNERGLNIDASGNISVATVTTVTTVSTVTDITNAVTVKGDVAHDTADSNSPQKIGAKAITALSGVTAVASADRTDLYADLDGILPVRLGAVHGDFVSGNASETAGASTAVIAAQGAGIRVYLTDVTLTNTSSTNTYCEIKDGTTVKWTFPVPANGGVTHRFATPLAGTANTAWNFDMGAAVTTAYASFSGYKSKV